MKRLALFLSAASVVLLGALSPGMAAGDDIVIGFAVAQKRMDERK